MAAARGGDRRGVGPQLRTAFQMGAKQDVERLGGQFFDRQQQITGRKVPPGFPVPPSGGADAELGGHFGDLEVLPQAPVFQADAEGHVGRIMVAKRVGGHCGK